MTCNSNCGCGSAAETTNQTTQTAQTTTQTAAAPVATFRPEIDIRETPEAYIVVADVPGATAEAVDITLDQGVLTFRATVPTREPAGARRVVREYGVGHYERSFRIGEGVDTDKIGAEVKDGVLTLTLPKAETTRARKIQVAG